MKKLCIAAALAFCAVGAQAASIDWGSALAPFLFEADGTTAVALGELVELVYVGADGIIQGDETGVLASSTVGTGTGKVSLPGMFEQLDSTYVHSAAGGTYGATDQFYIRFYSGGNMGVVGADLAGTVGPAETVADGAVWSITAGDNTGTDAFNAATASTGLYSTVVPEPGTVMLGLAGLGALVARRRKNRK